jgi:hypothetical protein
MSSNTLLVAAAMHHHQQMMAQALLMCPPSLFFPPLPQSFLPLLCSSNTEPPHPTTRPDIRSLDDATALFRFRFTVREMEEIVAALRLPPTYTVHRVTVSSFVALAMVLRRLVYPLRLGDLVVEFGYDITSLSLIINHLMTTLSSRFLAHLQLWPGITQQKVRVYEHAVSAHMPGVRRIWGFIDGTLRAIARPEKQQRASFSGYKRHHGQHYQAVVAPDGLVVSLIGPFVGSRNDITVYHESYLDALLTPFVSQGTDIYHLFGDKAYRNLPLVMSPFHPALTDEEEQYNTALSSLRVSVEHAFGKITQLWSFTDLKRVQRTGLQPTAAYYHVMVLMSNLHTCMHGNQISEKFDCAPPSMLAYIGNT